MFSFEDDILDQMEQRVIELSGDEATEGTMGPIILMSPTVERQAIPELPNNFPINLALSANELMESIAENRSLMSSISNDNSLGNASHLDPLTMSDQQQVMAIDQSRWERPVSYNDQDFSADISDLRVDQNASSASMDTDFDVPVTPENQVDVHVANDNREVLSEISSTLAGMHRQSAEELARAAHERNKARSDYVNDGTVGGGLTPEQIAALGIGGGGVGADSGLGITDVLLGAAAANGLRPGRGTPTGVPPRPPGSPPRGGVGGMWDKVKGLFKAGADGGGSKAGKYGKVAGAATIAYLMFGDTIKYAYNNALGIDDEDEHDEIKQGLMSGDLRKIVEKDAQKEDESLSAEMGSTFAKFNAEYSEQEQQTYKPVVEKKKEESSSISDMLVPLLGLSGLGAGAYATAKMNASANSRFPPIPTTLGPESNLNTSRTIQSAVPPSPASATPHSGFPPRPTPTQLALPSPQQMARQVQGDVIEAASHTAPKGVMATLKKLPGIDLAFAAMDVSAIMSNEELSDRDRKVQLTGVLGGIGGSKVGALAGGAAMSWIPVVGAPLGALIGGIGGYFAGDSMAEYAIDSLLDDEDAELDALQTSQNKYIVSGADKHKTGMNSESLPYHPVLNPDKNDYQNRFFYSGVMKKEKEAQQKKQDKAVSYAIGKQTKEMDEVTQSIIATINKPRNGTKTAIPRSNYVTMVDTVADKEQFSKKQNKKAVMDKRVRKAAGSDTGLSPNDARLTTGTAATESSKGRSVNRQTTMRLLGNEASKIPTYYSRDKQGYESFESDYKTGSSYSTYIAIYDEMSGTKPTESNVNLGIPTNSSAQAMVPKKNTAASIIKKQSEPTSFESMMKDTSSKLNPAPEAKKEVPKSGGKTFRTPEQFIEAMLPQAQAAAAELGVDPNILIAQAALETGWGKHVNKNSDGTSSNNLFNIKADKRWKGDTASVNTKEYDKNGKAYMMDDDFRSYGSYNESFSNYSDFLQTNPRYKDALTKAGNGEEYLKGLQKAGYATDPTYAKKIMSIANSKRFSKVKSKMEADLETSTTQAGTGVDVPLMSTGIPMLPKEDVQTNASVATVAKDNIVDNKILSKQGVETKSTIDNPTRNKYYSENTAITTYDTEKSATKAEANKTASTQAPVMSRKPASGGGGSQRPQLQTIPVIIDDSGVQLIQLGYV